MEVLVEDLTRKCPICRRNKVKLRSFLNINIDSSNTPLEMLITMIANDKKIVHFFFIDDIKEEIKTLLTIWNDIRIFIPCCACNALLELLTDPSQRHYVVYSPEISPYKTKPYRLIFYKDKECQFEYISKIQYLNFRKFGIINE